jgi:hypothetical protein
MCEPPTHRFHRRLVYVAGHRPGARGRDADLLSLGARVRLAAVRAGQTEVAMPTEAADPGQLVDEQVEVACEGHERRLVEPVPRQDHVGLDLAPRFWELAQWSLA